ncbi:MAG TPA: hypothetical protein VMZ25_09685, partial [Terriglobales bacterium]|nr:hypothetical protein [Terriglobales bacterium]
MNQKITTWSMIIAILCLSDLLVAQPRNSTDKAVRDVVTQFEDGLKQRDLKKIEAVVAEDLVVFENGHR